MNKTGHIAYTEGSLWRHMIRLSLPLICGNIFQQLYNTIDAAVIGRYSSQLDFAAVGVSSSIMNLFLFALVGICTGLSVLFAQVCGNRDERLFRNYHFLAFAFGLLFTLFISVCGIVFLPRLLAVTSTPVEIMDSVTQYMVIVLAGMCITFLYNLYASMLRSIGKANIALGVLGIAVGVNLVLDIVLIRYCSMGIKGAAIATVIAQMFSTLACIIYLKRNEPQLLFHKEDCHVNGERLKHMAVLCAVTAIHQVSLYIGKLCVQGTVNAAGTDMISAYTATGRIEAFANSFGDSGSAATSVLVAQNIGASKKERVKQTFRVSLVWMILIGLVCSALMYLTNRLTVSFLLTQSEGAAFESACQYLKIISLFYLFCFTGNTFAGYFEGIGKPAIAFIGAVSHITLRVILCRMFVPMYGLSAVAIASGIGWILVNVFWSFCTWKNMHEGKENIQVLRFVHQR